MEKDRTVTKRCLNARLDDLISPKNSLFPRGNLQQDRASTAPQFPGDAPNTVSKTRPKALAEGCTSLLRSNLTNSFRYGYLFQTFSSNGLQSQPYVGWDKMSTLTGETSTTIQKDPVHNIEDSLTWTKGRHTLQFGTNLRIVTDYSSTNARSFSSAITNPNGLLFAAIANTGQSLDLGAFGFPAVTPGYNSTAME